MQVNAGGKWRDDDDIKLLISDIFSPFSVKARCKFIFSAFLWRINDRALLLVEILPCVTTAQFTL